MALKSFAFKQHDVTRALKATVAAGIQISRVEIDVTGKIVIIAGRGAEEQASDFDQWKARHANEAQGYKPRL